MKWIKFQTTCQRRLAMTTLIDEALGYMSETAGNNYIN